MSQSFLFTKGFSLIHTIYNSFYTSILFKTGRQFKKEKQIFFLKTKLLFLIFQKMHEQLIIKNTTHKSIYKVNIWMERRWNASEGFWKRKLIT